MGGRLFVTTALAVTVAVGLAGCTAPGSEADAGVKNQAAWKMPLDEFVVYSPELDNYAEQLLISDCLGAQGYEWPVPWQDTEFPRAEDVNEVDLRLFNLELAKKWGYHFARLDDPESAELWLTFTETVDSYFPNQELDDALVACTDKIRAKDKSSLSNFDGRNYISELTAQAMIIVEQDPDVAKAVKAWRECLTPRVDYAVTQEQPWEGAPSAERQKWGAVTGSDSQPSVEELAAAVADAECQESSGWASLWYERNWEEQEKLVAENRDKLDRIRADAIERKKKLLTIVAENAPAAP
ncbi:MULTISPECIES: hypothetical protein [unclassified Microbacterium]|uniref:hypothetical protein n=1 Tax=unclassified Microbacterium TaxID=2609290 RepID=UPI0011BEB950|nr:MULTISPECIES: hypothetical protein [unclassified Microbacterium]NYF26522.1 hypothetical protein [Microbacterium sp. JAI119]